MIIAILTTLIIAATRLGARYAQKTLVSSA
jgi:hypothetical protein